MNNIIGKTIKKVIKYGSRNYSDTGTLKIIFTDNTWIYIHASYGAYDGRALDEYPVNINIATETELIPLEVTYESK